MCLYWPIERWESGQRPCGRLTAHVAVLDRATLAGLLGAPTARPSAHDITVVVVVNTGVKDALLLQRIALLVHETATSAPSRAALVADFHGVEACLCFDSSQVRRVSKLLIFAKYM